MAGHNDCMAGLGGTCSHVAAKLWAIESGVRLRDSMTVTQKKAYWVIPNGVKEPTLCACERNTLYWEKAKL